MCDRGCLGCSPGRGPLETMIYDKFGPQKSKNLGQTLTTPLRTYQAAADRSPSLRIARPRCTHGSSRTRCGTSAMQLAPSAPPVPPPPRRPPPSVPLPHSIGDQDSVKCRLSCWLLACSMLVGCSVGWRHQMWACYIPREASLSLLIAEDWTNKSCCTASAASLLCACGG
jgi:hypothetical protein